MATDDRKHTETRGRRPGAETAAQLKLPKTLTVPLTRVEDGTLRLTGTRVPIDRVVYAYLQGQTAEQFCQDFPSVRLADVHAVIAYYLQNRETVDRYLRLREREAEELRHKIERDFPVNALRERLSKQREELKAHSDALR